MYIPAYPAIETCSVVCIEGGIAPDKWDITI